jgi:prepilin-type N-terminal cleavage/methylation domain-containing protein
MEMDWQSPRPFKRKKSPTLRYENKRRSAGGFTLLELIFALAILCLGVLFLSGLSITTLKVNRSSQNRTAALQLAQEKLETMKAQGFTELRGEVESGLSVGSLETIFRRETVVNIESSGNLADITVRVLWSGSVDSKLVHFSELFTRIAR